MNNEQRIKVLLSHVQISQTRLAELLGTTSSNLNQKIKKGTLTEKDMEAIAAAVGAVYDSGFRFPDGLNVGFLNGSVITGGDVTPKKIKGKKQRESGK